MNDDIVLVGDRVYVKATATLSNGESSVSTSAFAREAETKKGMDDAQVTGSTSSYARKYALNGLLLIDDNKDADHGDNSEPAQKPKPVGFNLATSLKWISEGKTPEEKLNRARSAYGKAVTDEDKATIKEMADSLKVAA